MAQGIEDNLEILAEIEAADVGKTYRHAAMGMSGAGVDMGRNIFQSEAPVAMIKAVRSVVHENETPEKAFELYNSLKTDG